jgi:hypothetical protein
LPLDRIKQAVDTAWPLLVEKIRREAAKPLEARITDLEGEMWHTKDCCSDVLAKNHCLYQDVQDLEDDLDNARRECTSLHEKHKDPIIRIRMKNHPLNGQKGRGGWFPLPPPPNCRLVHAR